MARWEVCIGVIIICNHLTFACTVTPETFNKSVVKIEVDFQYTRSDGLTAEYLAFTSVHTAPGILWFGGAKATPDSPTTLTCELLSSAPLVGTFLSQVLGQFEIYCSDQIMVESFK